MHTHSTHFSQQEMALFTRSEREEKNYTIGRAVASARRALTNKGVRSICVNALKGRPDSTPITLVELNRLACAMINDTLYHATDSDYFPDRHPR